MKRLFNRTLSIILVLTMLIAIASVSVSALALAEDEAVSFLKYEILGGEVTITDCKNMSAAGEFIIPEAIEGYPVTSIGEAAFQYFNATSITIPSTVKYIYQGCFNSANQLKEINVSEDNPYFTSENGILFNKDKTILLKYPENFNEPTYTYDVPQTVKAIADYAFYGTITKSVNLNDGLETIGKMAFYNSKIIRAIIPDSVTQIDTDAFSYCMSLATVSFGKGLETIGMIMRNNSSITQLAIPGNIKTIESKAFENLTALETVGIGAGLENFNASAFLGCVALKNVSVAQGNEHYASGLGIVYTKNYSTLVLYPCGYVDTKYTFPENVVAIGDYAFQFSQNLKEIVFRDDLEAIGNYAFFNSVLRRIHIPDNVKTIGDHAFEETYISELTIGEGVVSIGDFAFYNALGADSLYIPASVEHIGTGAFMGSELYLFEKLEVSPENQYYSSQDNVLFNKDKTLLIQCPALILNQEDELVETYTIPDSVKKIGEYAFYDFYITNIIFGKNVTTVANSAFYQNSNIKTVTLNEGLVSIGADAFCKCYMLKNVDIPTTVDYIGENAFSRTSIEKITIPQGVSNIKEGTFRNSGIKEVYIPLSVTAIDDYAFGYCGNLADVYYSGTKAQFNKIAVGKYNEDLTVYATIHYNFENAHPHTGGEWKVTKEPTCTSMGEESFICAVCSQAVEARTIDCTPHTPDEWEVLEEPTCTKLGKKVLYCKDCNFEIEYADIEMLSHKMEWVVVTPPGCAQVGYERYECTSCGGSSDSRYIPPLSYHEVGEWVVTTPATCTENGVETAYCINCEKGYKTREIPATHTNSFWVVKSSASCTTGGEELFYCADCEKLLASRETAPTGHSSEWITTKEPDYIQDGEMKSCCTVCEEVLETKKISKLQSSVNSVDIPDNIILSYKDKTIIYPSISVAGIPQYTVNYSVADNSVATVDDNGEIIAVKRGKTLLTVTVTDEQGNEYSDVCNVEVKYTFWQWLIKIILFGWIWY